MRPVRRALTRGVINDMKTRIIVVGIIVNEKGEVLLLKMPPDRGIYPGQWGVVGGGLEEGETLEEALAREVKEEVGLVVKRCERTIYFDEVRSKAFPDGHVEEIYMIYHLYHCECVGQVQLNEEWETFVWVSKNKLSSYDLNSATRYTFTQNGWL